MAKKWETTSVNRLGGKKVSVNVINTQTGDVRLLMTQHGKFHKNKAELDYGVKMTNAGEIKHDKNGNPIKLTRAQRAYRAGYNSALGESASIYKSKQRKNQKKKQNGGNK